MPSPSPALLLSKHSGFDDDTLAINVDETQKNSLNIMEYDSERQILASLFAMRAMLRGWKSWSVGRNNYHAGDTLKRIFGWYKETLQPITLGLTRDHMPPKFARKAIRTCLRFEVSPDLHGLHIVLLLSATTEVIKKCRGHGVGPKSRRELERWCQMLILTIDSQLFQYAPTTTKKEFVLGCESLQELIRDPLETTQEYPGFNGEALFIQIAHMVLFYSESPVYDTLPGKFSHVIVTKSTMNEWETHAGKLMGIVFQLDRHGLSATFDDSMLPPTIANIQLPYSILVREVTSMVLPSITDLHQEVMNRFIQWADIISQTYSQNYWVGESKKVLFTFSHGQDLNEVYDWNNKTSEKVKKNYRKNHPGCGTNHPAQFPRDIFLMGMHSYHRGYTRRYTCNRNTQPRPRFQIGHLRG